MYLSAIYFHSDTRELRLDAPPAFFHMLFMRPQAALLLALHSPAPLSARSLLLAICVARVRSATQLLRCQ